MNSAKANEFDSFKKSFVVDFGLKWKKKKTNFCCVRIRAKHVYDENETDERIENKRTTKWAYHYAFHALTYTHLKKTNHYVFLRFSFVTFIKPNVNVTFNYFGVFFVSFVAHRRLDEAIVSVQLYFSSVLILRLLNGWKCTVHWLNSIDMVVGSKQMRYSFTSLNLYLLRTNLPIRKT